MLTILDLTVIILLSISVITLTFVIVGLAGMGIWMLVGSVTALLTLSAGLVLLVRS